ncbi:hypothetical protein PMI35_04214 [Pseudomonas sp. GM78]|nr:hypothetical protein PMI35_04214 [Pseudomonas sp. GM78]
MVFTKTFRRGKGTLGRSCGGLSPCTLASATYATNFIGQIGCLRSGNGYSIQSRK